MMSEKRGNETEDDTQQRRIAARLDALAEADTKWTTDRLICIVGAADKIHLRREVHIHDTILEWLLRCRRESGPIVEGPNFDDRLRQARAAAGIIEWPNDVLRHTFATYHAAAFKNLNETARQMGHIGGLIVLCKHYVAYVPEKEAKKFWALTPTSVMPPSMGDS